MARPDLQGTIERLSTTLAKSGKSRREERRATRKELKRERQLEKASVPGGIFALVMALAMVGIAVTQTQFWWLIFVALSVGAGGANQLALVKERERLAGGTIDEKKQIQPGHHEIDALCDQLLTDLKASPEVVRAFLQHPEKTVEALRTTAKAVDQRRKDLAGAGSAEQLTALDKQRADLTSRRDASSDVEARVKFDGALRSLDGQESALKLLVAVSERLDGEYTSLLVLLQELKTRVAVARSTNTGSQLDGLEQNVQRLNAELQAITESLVMTPVDEGATGESTESTDSLSPRERVGVRGEHP